MKILFLVGIVIVFFVGCSFKEKPIKQKTATILLKTKQLKYNDSCFITIEEGKIHLSLFQLGTSILELDIYPNRVCKNFLFCKDGKEFNKEFFEVEYEEDFLYQLLLKDKVDFRDKSNGIVIVIENGEIERN